MARSFSAVINFHSRENRPQSDGICVANHTSPIDVVILSCDRAYALVNIVRVSCVCGIVVP
jgi:glycerol-3-phosphate O-acyltransferase 3/4